MFAALERVLQPTAPPDRPEPPPGLAAFYWHFARQAKGLFAALFVTGFVVALLDSAIPVFVGRIVTLLTASQPERLFSDYWHLLAGMALVLLVIRPAAIPAQNLIANQRSPPTSATWSVGKAIGTWCGNPGRSSRATSPGVSPTRSCRPGRRCARAWSRCSPPSGTSWCTAPAPRCCSPPPTGGSRCRCCCGLPATWCSCAPSCRACATVRLTCRRPARCSPAASSTPTPTSSR